MEKPVLVVIDMLHDFLESWEAARRQRLVSSINELRTTCRHFAARLNASKEASVFSC
jgi:isochorismate hydrolase